MNSTNRMLAPAVTELLRTGILRPLDTALLESMLRTRADAPLPPAAQLALALAVRATGAQHTCLRLSRVTPAFIAGLDPANEQAAIPPDTVEACRMIAEQGVRDPRNLFAGNATIVGAPDDQRPFVLADDRLYLRRYWHYEATVAAHLAAMAAEAPAALPTEPDPGAAGEQQAAVRLALSRRLAIITGGPGTGKTHTVARILAAIGRQHRQTDRPLLIGLAAPTGKAAARMDESIRQALSGPDTSLPDGAIPPACTIERLLGPLRHSPYFRHDRHNPLPADLVIVDEASMLDLARAAKLIEALRPEARLILLGDADQLAAVQPGRLLAELCRCPRLAPCVISLQHSFRFPPERGIGRLSAAIRAHDADSAWTALQTPTEELRLHRPPELAAVVLPPELAARIRDGYHDFMRTDTPAAAFAALGRFRVLCAVRRGPAGVIRINRLIEDLVTDRGPRPEFYGHRVIMITVNDYAAGLFNGDIGVILTEAGGGGPAAFFEPRQAGGPWRRLACSRLPPHETAFAMTVHKAQGSEFERVAIILPRRPHPVVTRELIYTAVTRARSGVDLCCTEAALRVALTDSPPAGMGLLEMFDSATQRIYD